ncbi:MAG: DNA primase noncatalytic subunit PriX [Acidilobaceae archaeon]|nr:DNA primase noncatalytic subunit PriX [Acidilobaceae archaeon]MCX8165316.1 DNA primase noncatalytic subunit PriX [Acidilobaceae archaeon]MDW7973742.1 DNA primase noncatalytic subunit PriX [Sulfolobales archaeon]
MSWEGAVERCVDEASCEQALREFFERKSQEGPCEPLPHVAERAAQFRWVERLIEMGAPDGRQRLILYVISRYLINVKQVSTEEALREVERFLENSCKNYGNCGRVYPRWIRQVLESVRSKKWPPWSLEKVKERDPQLYEVIVKVTGGPAGI